MTNIFTLQGHTFTVEQTNCEASVICFPLLQEAVALCLLETLYERSN